MDIVLKSLATIIGVLGFLLLFGVNKKHWIITSLLGGLDYLIYAIIYNIDSNAFFSCFYATIIIEIIVYIISKIKKAPRVVFSTSIMISLVPGGLLYHTMRYLIEGNILFKQTAFELLLTACGLAAGRMIIHTGFKFMHDFRKRKDH